MLTPEHIFQRAAANHAKVGIGLGEDSRKVLKSVHDAERKGYAEVVTFETAEGMIASLRNGEVDAVVRGDLSANQAMAEVKAQFSLDHLLRALSCSPRAAACSSWLRWAWTKDGGCNRSWSSYGTRSPLPPARIADAGRSALRRPTGRHREEPRGGPEHS